jgi:hypothetical protein
MSAEDDLFAQRRAEVLRLTYAEGRGIRAISRRLKMARKTVRKLLDGERASTHDQTGVARARLLGPFEGAIRQVLAETPEVRPPCSSACGYSAIAAGSRSCAIGCARCARARSASHS